MAENCRFYFPKEDIKLVKSAGIFMNNVSGASIICGRYLILLRWVEIQMAIEAAVDQGKHENNAQGQDDKIARNNG